MFCNNLFKIFFFLCLNTAFEKKTNLSLIHTIQIREWTCLLDNHTDVDKMHYFYSISSCMYSQNLYPVKMDKVLISIQQTYFSSLKMFYSILWYYLMTRFFNQIFHLCFVVIIILNILFYLFIMLSSTV